MKGEKGEREKRAKRTDKGRESQLCSLFTQEGRLAELTTDGFGQALKGRRISLMAKIHLYKGANHVRGLRGFNAFTFDVLLARNVTEVGH